MGKMKTGSVLGYFTKALPGSVSVNFGVSGGKNCDGGCLHNPNYDGPTPELADKACYAATGEHSFKGAYTLAKLVRHEQWGPAQVIGKATYELQELIRKGQTIPWVRISTNGSIPQPWEATPLFISQLRTFLKIALAHGAKIHFPVESAAKAEFYREKVGDLVCVRESLQSVDAITETSGAVSFVVGAEIVDGPDIYQRRVDAAKAAAKLRKHATGRNTIVCPAVTSSWKRRTKAGKNSAPIKCGLCPLCSNRDADVVYPWHP